MARPEDPRPEEPARPPRVRVGFRLRVLGFAAMLLVGAAGVALLVQRAVLHQRLDAQVNEMLEQEREELERLAAGRDPETGEPFEGDVAAIFDTFLGRNVPATAEAFYTYVDGQPYRRSQVTRQTPVRLDTSAELNERWGDLQVGQRGEVATDAGAVRYLAVPLASGGETRGVFVVVNFLDRERGAIDADLRVQALVVAVVIAVATGIAWFIAGRLLRPLREVTAAARAISETDLSRRIPVESSDEVGQLAVTFNEMLDRLEEAFAAQRAFVDDAGHELRTPITVIMGQLELMGDDPEDRAATLAVVDDELGRMARIVEDLLLLAKAEQTDFVHRELVELSDFTTEVLMKARTLGDRDWRLDACATGTAELDPQRLTQALLNLARNAAEHTDPRTVVGIGSSRTADEVRFWVRDEGLGIPSDEQERIFDRFSRGRNARRRSDGAGLGLTIVRAVAAGHGGHVHLDSDVGRGSRFDLVLPLAGGDPGPPSDEVPAVAPLREGAPPDGVTPDDTTPDDPAPEDLTLDQPHPPTRGIDPTADQPTSQSTSQPDRSTRWPAS